MLPLSCALLAAASGCLGPRRDHYQSSCQLIFVEPSDDADRLWRAIEDTLRRHRYRMDRVDRRAGVITTMPAISQHVFEFWRQDVVTWPDLWESTLNPIRRWVEVRLDRTQDNAWRELTVMVHKERLSSPDRQFNSTGAAYQYFGESLPSITGRDRAWENDSHWLAEGRDAAMEEYLLRDILIRAGREHVLSPDIQTTGSTSGPDGGEPMGTGHSGHPVEHSQS